MTFDAPQLAWGDGIDLFVAKLIPGIAGKAGLQFSTYLGGMGIHVATCLTLGMDGTVYVGGYTTLGLPGVGVNARLYAGGSDDGFLLALTAVGRPARVNQS